MPEYQNDEDSQLASDFWLRGLLTRDQFRTQVFKRDGNKCVICGEPAQDAHHILERRLWPDGGYYLNNGASLCGTHHIQCETTDISVEEVRQCAGITKVVLPPHLYDDQRYDKWGNIILENEMRIRGELFYDESVQKILANRLSDFTHWVKYPRTYHLPWSDNLTDDDRMHPDVSIFNEMEVVVTMKMDGENTTMYSDYIHARSLDSNNHPSRNWVKGFWARIMGDIPQGWRLCGENLYATHSIHYTGLPSYFMGFSIWNEKNFCLPWDETLEWFKLLNVIPVPTLYRGIFDEKVIRGLWESHKVQGKEEREGYVVRFTSGFSYGEFFKRVGKYVRKNHVLTTKHWMTGQPIIPNELKKENP